MHKKVVTSKVIDSKNDLRNLSWFHHQQESREYFQSTSPPILAQSARAVKYTDCSSAEG